jgi:hypothetical protein
MVRYIIKLTKSEVGDLHDIINKGSHTSQTFRTAYILLNCYEGDYSEKVTNEQISKVLMTIRHLVYAQYHGFSNAVMINLSKRPCPKFLLLNL